MDMEQKLDGHENAWELRGLPIEVCDAHPVGSTIELNGPPSRKGGGPGGPNGVYTVIARPAPMVLRVSSDGKAPATE